MRGLIVGLMCFALAGCASPNVTASPAQPAPATTAPGATATAASSSHRQGISAAQARQIADGYAPLTATFERAVSGNYGGLSGGLAEGPSGPIATATMVWAVTYSNTVTICDQGTPPTCDPPRRGTATVYLDYYTGRYIAVLGSYPNP